MFFLGKLKVRTVILAILAVTFLAANLDYPKYWNAFADWANPKLDAVDVPYSIEKYDPWGIFRKIDEKAYIKHFWDLPFALGLDLQGGTHLVYRADLSDIPPQDRDDSMRGLRDVIERRVNLFGVREPKVQIEKAGREQRLIVELAGVKDVSQAIQMIGQTPYLEFREYSEEEETFIPTKLTGKYLESAQVQFDPQTNQPQVGLQFNDEGARLFAEITGRNVDKIVAIFIDGVPISTPRVQEKITGGQAQITGDFALKEVKSLARNLNAGALPVPIEIISQQTIGASLGEESMQKSIQAAFAGILAVVLFMLLVYRLAGLLAVGALGVYLILLLALFKLIPVTLTLPGIAGLILSVGLAVDANVLVFERLREELKATSGDLSLSIEKAFSRAWPSIRDGNVSTLITAGILFWFTTSFVKGFALTLGLGVLISMFSAMIVTRYFLKWFVGKKIDRLSWLWGR